MDIVTYALIKKYIQGLLSSGAGGAGVDGKSAYDLAVENGFSGTVEEWLESLKGQSAVISIGDDGMWYIDNISTGVSALGTDNVESIPDDQIKELF